MNENKPSLELEPEMSDELGVESHTLSRLSVGDTVIMQGLQNKGIENGSFGKVIEAEYINGRRQSLVIQVQDRQGQSVILHDLDPKYWKRVEVESEVNEEETLL